VDHRLGSKVLRGRPRVVGRVGPGGLDLEPGLAAEELEQGQVVEADVGRVAPEVVAEDGVAGRVGGHGHEPAAGGQHPPDPGQLLPDLVGGEVLDEVGAEHALERPRGGLAVQEGDRVGADHVPAGAPGGLGHALVGVDPLGLDPGRVEQAEELAAAESQLQHRAPVLEHRHVVAQHLAGVVGVEVHV